MNRENNNFSDGFDSKDLSYEMNPVTRNYRVVVKDFMVIGHIERPKQYWVYKPTKSLPLTVAMLKAISDLLGELNSH